MSSSISAEQFRSLYARKVVACRGRMRRTPGEMNRTEKAYSEYLGSLKIGGEILAYWFEAVGLRLGKKTFYYPDFLVMLPDGLLEMHDVKGTQRDKKTGAESARSEDDSLVKIKVAAELFPFPFVVVHREHGGNWKRREL